jgi:hypothetical protein
MSQLAQGTDTSALTDLYPEPEELVTRHSRPSKILFCTTAALDMESKVLLVHHWTISNYHQPIR